MKKLKILFRTSTQNGITFLDAIILDGDYRNNRVTTYATIGQHSEGCIEWLYNKTRPAAPIDYQELFKELRSIYSEHELEILDRLPWKSFFNKRYELNQKGDSNEWI